MKQPCLDCGRISPRSRCAEHTAAAKQRGQAVHEAARKRRGGIRNRGGGNLGGVGAGATCWICARPVQPHDPMQWDHLVPVRNGGEGMGVLPAHRSCNIRRHHELQRRERDRLERDDLDRRLMRGKYANRRASGAGGPGVQPVPGSNPASRNLG